MIDIHNHSLMNVDDGCKNIEEALALVESAYRQGCSDIIVTPHFILDGHYHEEKEDLLQVFEELKKQLDIAGLKIRLHLGNELFIHRDLPDYLALKKCNSLANSRYLLIEFPCDEYQDEYDLILQDLRVMGYGIIIAHPERYQYVRKDVNFCLRWLDEGDLLQCNQNSFFKKETSKLMMKLLKCNMISFIASDAHGEKRPFDLDKTYRWIKNELNEAIAEKLLIENPKKILNDELLVNDTYRPYRKFFGLFR